MVNYFTPQNYVPVLVNRGYTVGDVVEVDGVNFYARALRCFPRLKPPDPVQTALTDVLESSSAGVSFGLRLRQIFDSSAGADLVNRIRITFSGVTVVSVARLDLRDALDRQACPEIAPLVDATVTAVDRNRKVCRGCMGRQILARELDSGPAGHRATSRISRRGDDDSLCDPIKDVADALERGRSVVERGGTEMADHRSEHKQRKVCSHSSCHGRGLPSIIPAMTFSRARRSIRKTSACVVLGWSLKDSIRQ